MAADIGTLSRLPKVVGNMSAVREWAFTTQEFSAEDALRIGFVSKVIPGGRDEAVGKSPWLGWWWPSRGRFADAWQPPQ